jgi:hypothetical protein
VRKRDEKGNLIYCLTHQNQLKEHKTANCCDKSQGVKAYSRCFEFRKLRNKIKACGDCQSSKFFVRQIRRKIKCEKVLDLLVIKENKKNLLLFLIKEDNSCEKRSLLAVKT